MKKTLLLSAVLLIGTAFFVQAQTLDEVLENYHETIGQEVILKTKNSQSIGKMIQMGMEIPFKQYSARPNKFKVEATFQGMTLIQAYNGEEGWALNPFAGQTEPQPMSEDELKAVKVQADYEGMYWNWEEKGHQLTLEDNEEVEGSDCFVVKTVTKDGDEILTYIDAENYIVLKTKNKMTMNGQEMESETFMSNYQEANGIVYAGKIETRVGGQVTATIVIDEIQVDAELADDFFNKPKGQ